MIVDSHDFTNRNLNKAGYPENPLENDSLAEYDVHAFELTGPDGRGRQGVRPVPQGRQPREEHVRARAAVVDVRPPHRVDDLVPRAAVRQGPRHPRRQPRPRSTRAGTSARPPRRSPCSTRSSRPPTPAGTYRNITGNLALAYGLIAGSTQSGLPLFLGSYPITPASDILHELSKHKRFGVTTFQAEDEIAGVGAALGAAFGGALGVTTTSGPGIALKSETIGLGVMMELPLLVVDVQRGGPSTGLPTKTEQADLLQAMFGRNGEAPVPIVAPQSPADCFDAADRGHPDRGHLPHAGDAALRRLPRQRLRALADPRGRATCPASTRSSPPSRTTRTRRAQAEFWPYLRDEETLARPVGGARHPRSRAPHRRPGEGRGAREHLLRPRQPRLHGPHPRRQGGADRRRTSRRWRSTTPSGRGGARCWCSAGVDVRPDRRRRPAGPQRRPTGRAGAPAAPQPVPVRPRRRAEAVRRGDGPRDEPRPARRCCSGRSTSSTSSATTTCAACRCGPPSSPRRSPT